MRDDSSTSSFAAGPSADPHPAFRQLFNRLLAAAVWCRRVTAPGEPIDCVILAVNPAFTERTGLTDVVGRRVRELFTGPDNLADLLERPLLTGKPEQRELWSPVSARWVELSVYPVSDDELFVVSDDLSSRRQMVSGDLAGESMLDATGRIARVGGWRFDLKTGRGAWTAEVPRIHGLPADAEPRHDMVRYAEMSRPLLAAAIAQARRDGTPWDLELELQPRDGRRHWVRCIGQPAIENGRVTQLHGTLQDITDRKLVEHRLATQNAVSRILATASSVSDAVPGLLEAMCETERWDAGILFMVDPAGDVLRSVGAWARPGTVGTTLVAGVQRFTFPRGGGLLGEAWATGQSSLQPISALMDRPEYALASLTREQGYQSVLACPLETQGQVVGVCCFLSLDVRPDDMALRESCASVGQQFALFAERKRAEEALAQSELRHRMLVEQASDGIFLVTPDGRYQEVNARYVEMIGHPREDLIGSSLGSLLVEEERQRVAPTFARLREQGSHVAEFRIHRGDGQVIEIEVSGRLLQDGSVLGLVRDITRRKQAEAEVQRRLELEAQLSRLAAAAPGAMYSYRHTVEGKPEFAYVSPQIEELTGLTPSEIHADGSALIRRIPLEDRAGFEASMQESARAMTLWTRTFRHHHPRKGMRWLDGRSMPVREADGSITWHGFMADITERRELEEQLRQAQKMEAIGQLASGVAHDFNNLLTVIQGNASLLADDTTARQECAEEILQASERAAALTRQLLLFSRKQEMHATDLDLNEVVENMTKLLRRIVGEDITLRAEYSARPAIIRADAGMMEQVLLNLAVNSRDAMPDGGRLTIATLVEDAVIGERRSLVARLRFSDTGSGISPDVLPRIFEPFFTTKDVGKGTGLGLATVYAIVRQHNGTIEVESHPDEGTTFVVTLPAIAQPDRHVRRHDGASEAPRGTEVVLVVEDEPAVRHLVAHLLQRSGYTVLTAETGRRALAVFAQHQFEIDLLLTDMVMPDGLSGRQLAAALLEQRPDLKVVYTSGYTADATATDLALVPGRNFIQKPYQPAELARTVRTALDT